MKKYETFGLSVLSIIALSCEPLRDLSPKPWPRSGGEHPPGRAAQRHGPDDSVFDRERVSEIQISLSEYDWEQLRYEAKPVVDYFQPTLDSLNPFPYTTFTAQVTIDGQPYSNVGIRKAGFLGNLSSQSPQLELAFGRGGTLQSGLRTLALKNDLEDATRIRECMAFDLYRAAGYPASRCSFARVTVNGVDVGYYTNVESIDEKMLAQHFEDASGSLFRGELADFFQNTLHLIRNKNHPLRNDRAGLERVLAALDGDASRVVAELGAVVDLNAFREFWALETFLAHWDGYSNVANNYYLYQNPHSGKFVFLPWDLDQAFVGSRPFAPPYEITVYYAGRIASVLYADPEQRQRFRTRLGELNDQLGDVPALLGQMDALTQLVPGEETARQAHRDYLETHGGQLREALSMTAPEVPPAQPFSPPEGDECAGMLTPVSGTFSAETSAGVYLEDSAVGSATMQTFPDGERLAGESFSLAGLDVFVPQSGAVYVATQLPNGTQLGFALILPKERFVPGLHPLHALETFIAATRMLPFDTETVSTFGYVIDGEIVLEQASLELGAAVVGSFSGTLYQQGCSPNTTPDGG